jgi:hypothetical protein
MPETLGIAAFIFSLLMVWNWANWLIWRFPGYREFRLAMEKVEHAHVLGTRVTKFERPLTMRSLGERRVQEIMELAVEEEFDMRMVRCFGAMFMKDESITESIDRLQASCAISLLALIGGAAWFVVSDAGFQAQLAASGTWEILPRIWSRVRSAELVMYTELIVAGVALVTLYNAAQLLKKLNREVPL